MAYKKPRLNRTVYIVYDRMILKEKARYIGEHSFVVAMNDEASFESLEWFYDEFNVNWAISLAKAKSLCRKLYNIKKLKLKHYTGYCEWWEVIN